MTAWDSVTSAIRDATHRPFTLRKSTPVGGGSINEAYQLEGTDGSRYFLKLNHAQHLSMFVAETAGLNTIAATGTIRVPRPIAHGRANEQCYLILEYLELGSRGNAKMLGVQLAALHGCKGKSFGFAQDNFIGTTPQPNTWKADWIDFWREHRLGFQLRLAAQNGYGGSLQRLGEKLMDELPAVLRELHTAILAAARRPVGRQSCISCRRHAGDLRSRDLLR